MRIATIEDFHADGGWQVLSFLKVTADDGRVGWSEFNEGFTRGLGSVIRALGHELIGRDPREVSRLCAELRARARPASGGINAQAAAAIENACLDIKARALGVPVYELFGGAHRLRVPAYWSHCGMYRLRQPALFEAAGLCVPRVPADMMRLGEEVAARGYRTLKTNLFAFPADGAPTVLMPGFGRGAAHPALDMPARTPVEAADLVARLQAGAGQGSGVMLDLNFNFKPEGVRRIARALDPLGLEWIEVDGIDPESLAAIRRGCRTPIASLETAYGRQALLPYLNARAVDVAVIDPMWNGFAESVRMAALCETFDINVASHLYSGTLACAMSAQFCAAIPNLRIMETDGDSVPWLGELFEGTVEVSGGEVAVPTGPGWGISVNEAGLRRHPPH
jgi:galactonate dehydratase